MKTCDLMLAVMKNSKHKEARQNGWKWCYAQLQLKAFDITNTEHPQLHPQLQSFECNLQP